MEYVIYLDTNANRSALHNDYGYWRGKNYTVEGDLFPICDEKIVAETKVYSSKGRAERGLKACLNKGYAYVVSGRIEPVKCEKLVDGGRCGLRAGCFCDGDNFTDCHIRK